MKNTLLYLNNTGSRWIVLDENGKHEERSWQTQSGRTITRRVIFYASFGNFGCCTIFYKGKRLSVLADSILVD